MTTEDRATDADACSRANAASGERAPRDARPIGDDDADGDCEMAENDRETPAPFFGRPARDAHRTAALNWPARVAAMPPYERTRTQTAAVAARTPISSYTIPRVRGRCAVRRYSAPPQRRKDAARARESSLLYAWLWQGQRLATPRWVPRGAAGKERTPTAYLLNGKNTGIIGIQDAEYAEFLELYAKDVDSGVEHFVSEQRSPVFKHHLDNDFLFPGHGVRMTRAEILRLARLYIEETKRFYIGSPDHVFAVIVLTAPPRDEKAKDGREYTKIGLHFVFPYLLVDSHAALVMRETYLARLLRELGPRDASNPWAKVVDHQIYTTNGFRMTYSLKKMPCPACDDRQPEKKSCGTCSSRGRITDPRPYEPYACLRGSDGGEDTFLTERLTGLLPGSPAAAPVPNRALCVRLTSIRTPAGTPPTPGFRPYEGAPLYDPIAVGTARGRSRPSSSASSAAGCAGEGDGRRGTGPSAGRLAIPSTCPRFATMLDLVRRRGHRAYARVDAKDMYCNRACTYYVLRVCGEGSRYCQNVDREHRTCPVYFLLTPLGLHQRCFCRCATTEGRRQGFCSEYRSLPLPITTDVRHLFFDVTRNPRCISGLYDLCPTDDAAAECRLRNAIGVVRRITHSDPSEPLSAPLLPAQVVRERETGGVADRTGAEAVARYADGCRAAYEDGDAYDDDDDYGDEARPNEERPAAPHFIRTSTPPPDPASECALLGMADTAFGDAVAPLPMLTGDGDAKGLAAPYARRRGRAPFLLLDRQSLPMRGYEMPTAAETARPERASVQQAAPVRDGIRPAQPPSSKRRCVGTP